jgi:hypothetical protein
LLTSPSSCPADVQIPLFIGDLEANGGPPDPVSLLRTSIDGKASAARTSLARFRLSTGVPADDDVLQA